MAHTMFAPSLLASGQGGTRQSLRLVLTNSCALFLVDRHLMAHTLSLSLSSYCSMTSLIATEKPLLVSGQERINPTRNQFRLALVPYPLDK
jgi:hypothetical protein